jgi:hypothetical protein
MGSGISRRTLLALGIAGSWRLSRAQQDSPAATVWIEPPRRAVSVANRDATGIAYAQQPFDYREAHALSEALGRANLDARALWAEAVRGTHAALQEADAVALAVDERSAGIVIEPRVFLWAMKGDRARMDMVTTVEIRVPGVRRFDLDCRTLTALVLPNKGEGGWTDEGFATLKQSVSRCARDTVLLVQTELNLRRRGLWTSPVEMERLQLIEYRVHAGGDPVRYEGLIVRETDATLSYAVAHGRGLGHLRNIRHILDKALITQRGPA